MHATMTTKGQITLPKALRDQLQLCAGDRVEFVLEENSSVRMMVKHASVSRLKGVLPKPQRSVPLDEMEAAIETGGRNA